MKISKKSVAIILVVLMILGLFTFFPVTLETYGGIDVSTKTKLWSHGPVQIGYWGHTLNRKFTFTSFCEKGELFYKNKYATSWSDTGESERFSLTTCGFNTSMLAWHGKYWWNVTLFDSSTGKWTQLIGQDGYVNHHLVYYLQGTPGEKTWESSRDSIFCGVKGWYGQDQNTGIKNIKCQAYPLEFSLKGAKAGVIRARLQMYKLCWQDNIWGVDDCGLSKTVITLVEDSAYLASGRGEVHVEDSPYGNKLFEEGDTATFAIKTGYSGESNNPWKLTLASVSAGVKVGAELKDDTGKTLTTDSTGSVYLKNDLVLYRLKWIIPDGSYNPSGSNEWKITLYNTLTEESQDYFFALFKGAHDYSPSISSIEVLNLPESGVFNFGDTVKVEITADANSEAAGTQYAGISAFKFLAFYGIQSQKEVETVITKITHVGGLTYKANYEFDVTVTSDFSKSLTMEATAFTPPGYEGGIPGTTGSKTLIIVPVGNDKNSIETTVTLDGSPLANAVVRVKTDKQVLLTAFTNNYGVVTFGDLVDGSYFVEASHPLATSGPKTSSVTLSGAKIHRVEINLEAGLGINTIIGIVLAFAAIIIFAMLAYMLPLAPAFKILVIVIGMAVAVIAFVLLYFMQPF